MAEVVFELVPTGNYFIVKGNGSDANSDFLREGIGSVIDAAAEAGDITILEEDYTDNWDPGARSDHGRAVVDPARQRRAGHRLRE